MQNIEIVEDSIMITVSIIMPVYKVEKYLRDSIESVLGQTYRDYELILVNDGSPDNCPNICNEYAKKYDFISVIHKANGGLSSARNAGLNVAKGKYVLFVDSDDTIERNLLENVVPQAEDAGADITIFGINTTVIKDGKVQAKKQGHHSRKEIVGRREVKNNFVALMQNGQWNFPVDKLYKRNLIEEHNIRFNSFYDRVCEDTVFLLDLIPFVNCISVVDGCYYNYAIRDTQSVVMSFIPERYEKYYGRFCKTRDVLLRMGIENEEFLYQLYCTFILWAYEMMFHKDCRYTWWERYKYIKNTFFIRKEPGSFCSAARKYIKKDPLYLNASKTSRKVLDSILKNKYRRAWFYHIFALIRKRNG